MYCYVNQLSNVKKIQDHKKKFCDIDFLDIGLLQQYIPMVDKKTGEVTDFDRVIEACQDIFTQKRKTIQSIALLAIFTCQELPTLVSAHSLAETMQE